MDELRRIWDRGDAAFPLDLRLPTQMQAELLRSVGASAIVDSDGEHSLSDGFPTEDGDALVVATSGTTGDPKGVVHTHDSIRASAERTSERLSVDVNDHWLACLPLAHIGGLSVVTRALLTNTPLTVLPRFGAGAVMQAARNGATLTSLVTAALTRIDSSMFRKILLGGAAPPADRPANTIATYGMTETGSGIVYETSPLRDVEIRIENSEIYVKSPTLFRCYRDGTDPKNDGWFATGDAGEFVNGVLRVHGRIEEVINTGGEKVWPAHVESVLRTHANIHDVRVIGEPDAEWGERVVAEVVSENPPSLDSIRDHVKQSLPAYCAPRELRLVKEIPRTPSGKIRRPS